MVAGAVALIAQRIDEPRVLYGAGLVGSASFRSRASATPTRVPWSRPCAKDVPRSSAPREARGLRSSCRRRRAPRAPGPPHRPRSHRATARGERPRRPRPSRSGRGAGFRGRGRRRGRVRLAALASLGRVDAGAPPQSRPRLSDTDPSVRLAALRVLARAGVDPPRQSLDDEEVSVRALAAAILFEREARARPCSTRSCTRRIRRFERSARRDRHRRR